MEASIHRDATGEWEDPASSKSAEAILREGTLLRTVGGGSERGAATGAGGEPGVDIAGRAEGRRATRPAVSAGVRGEETDRAEAARLREKCGVPPLAEAPGYDDALGAAARG